MKKLRLPGILVLFAILGASLWPAGAVNIHMHYFEAADATLSEESLQVFSFAGIRGEDVTIVAHKLDTDVVPQITVLDTQGVTLEEDANTDNDSVAVVQFNVPENGIYTFLVSRKGEAAGTVRVLLFEGEPLGEAISLLDTVDPFLPMRSYLISGSDEEPVTMEVYMTDEEGNRLTPEEIEEQDPGFIFAARGSSEEAPPQEERVTPVRSESWVNDVGQILYTLTVSPTADEGPVSQKLQGQFSIMAQVLDLVTIRLDINGGTDFPVFIQRLECQAIAEAGTALFGDPNLESDVTRTLGNNMNVEIVGTNGNFYLVVDPNSPTGGAWVPQGSLNLQSNINGVECSRVVPVAGDSGTTPSSLGGANLPDSY